MNNILQTRQGRPFPISNRMSGMDFARGPSSIDRIPIFSCACTRPTNSTQLAARDQCRASRSVMRFETSGTGFGLAAKIPVGKACSGGGSTVVRQAP